MEAFLVDVPTAIHNRAKAIAARQQQVDQAQVVYLNNLAVYATHVYLRCMGVPVDLEQSDSQDLVFQTLSNTGALMLPGLGKVECRLVTDGAEVMTVPEGVWGDRIGYLAIQFNQDGSEASLLGFVKAVDSTTVPLSQLESLSAFLDHLDQLKHQPQAQPETGLATSVARFLEKSPVTRLSQWLDQTLESGWQVIEALKDDWIVAPSEPAIAFRQSNASQQLADSEVIQRGKVLKFNGQGEPSQLKLLVGFRPHVTEDYEVRVRLSPTHTPYLMPGIKLFLLDDAKSEVFQAQTRSQNDSLQFIFNGSVGDEFSIKIAHENTTFEETFIIDL
jgi:hypothetical protein